MSRNSNYLGGQRCCYTKTPITGPQGAPGARGPIGPAGTGSGFTFGSTGYGNMVVYNGSTASYTNLLGVTAGSSGPYINVNSNIKPIKITRRYFVNVDIIISY